MVHELNNQDLVRYYTEQLKKSGVHSAAELREKASQIDLTFDDSKFISLDHQQEIIQDNPDNIKVGDKEINIIYRYDQYRDKQTAKIIVEPVVIFDIDETPTIPSGIEITVEVRDNGYEKFSGVNLEELKDKAETYLLEKLWNEYYSVHEDAKPQTIKDFNPATSPDPELPAPINYGTNPRSGEAALAIPALTYKQSYWSNEPPSYSIQYYKTQAEANEAQAKISEIREETLRKQRYEQEKMVLVPQARTIYGQALSSLEEMVGLGVDDRRELQIKISKAGVIIDTDPQSALQILAEVQNKIDLTEKILEEKRHKIQEIMLPLQSRLVDIQEKNVSIDNLATIASDHYLPTAVLKYRQKWQDFKNDIERGMIVADQVQDIVDDLESLGKDINIPLLQDYLENVSTKNQGIFAKINIEDGRVYLISPYNINKEAVSTIEVGRSGRTFYISKGKQDKIDFRPSGQWGSGITLSSGSYAIGRDGEYVYQVTFTSSGAIQDVLDKTIGEIKSQSNSKHELKEELDLEIKDTMSSDSSSTLELENGELSPQKRKKLENELRETETKLEKHKQLLLIDLATERASSLDITSGETNIDISKPRTKFVADFTSQDTEGNFYAEVVDWSTNKVRRFMLPGNQGIHYVEVSGEMPGGDFHSEELDLDGTSHRVKLVSLIEVDEQVSIYDKKISKIKSRLNQK